MGTPTILKTKDYSIFKSVKFNREKNKRHIESIKKIITKENLLHLHPILVNGDMEVIDGQHRLEAAKALNLDIFYIQDKISYDHILNSNLFQKKMVLEDVIKFYALKDKLKDYIEFMEYIELLGISPKSLIALMFGTVSIPMIGFIKSGMFKMPPRKETLEKIILSFEKFKQFTVEKRITPFSIFSSCNFVVAFRNIILMREYNEDVFYSKLEQRWFDLKPQLNSKEWTRALIGIYNWKNQNPIREDNGS
jgi:hypothetical protein